MRTTVHKFNCFPAAVVVAATAAATAPHLWKQCRAHQNVVIVWVNAQQEHRFSITEGRFIVVALHLFLATFATTTTTTIMMTTSFLWCGWKRARVCVRMCDRVRMHRYVYLFWMNSLMSTSNSTDSLYQIICWINTSKHRRSAIDMSHKDRVPQKITFFRLFIQIFYHLMKIPSVPCTNELNLFSLFICSIWWVYNILYIYVFANERIASFNSEFQLINNKMVKMLQIFTF